jgi:hypothetical protein
MRPDLRGQGFRHPQNRVAKLIFGEDWATPPDPNNEGNTAA